MRIFEFAPEYNGQIRMCDSTSFFRAFFNGLRCFLPMMGQFVFARNICGVTYDKREMCTFQIESQKIISHRIIFSGTFSSLRAMIFPSSDMIYIFRNTNLEKYT